MSDNNMNSADNGNNKKSTYFAESQKRYGEKCVKYTVKYTLNENEVSAIVVDTIEKSGLTANRWIKNAIKEKLERDGLLTDGVSVDDMTDGEQ